MIAALLLTLASPSTPVPELDAGYASDTIRHLKGHPSLPAGSTTRARTAVAAAACHPDPNKGRACRHHHARAEAARGEPRVLGEGAEGPGKVTAR